MARWLVGVCLHFWIIAPWGAASAPKVQARSELETQNWDGESFPLPEKRLHAGVESLSASGKSLSVPEESLPVPGESLPVAEESLPAAEESLPVAEESLSA